MQEGGHLGLKFHDFSGKPLETSVYSEEKRHGYGRRRIRHRPWCFDIIDSCADKATTYAAMA